MVRRLRVATRSSPLALAQTALAIEALVAALPGWRMEQVPLTTAADSRPHVPISELGDKGVFTSRLEAALLSGEADIAVHSLKDLPVAFDPRFIIAAYLAREDPRDLLIASEGRGLVDLEPGAVLGTSSLRRSAQLRQVRPDLEFRPIRGNVESRLAKVAGGEFDAVVLAAAGLHRLQFDVSAAEYLDPATCTPAPGQGTIVIQALADSNLLDHMRAVSVPSSETSAMIERSVAAALGADCTNAFGALASFASGTIHVHGFLADGSASARVALDGPDPAMLTRAVVDALRNGLDGQ
jgi:hydroxymethylbilane synthase